MTWQRRFLWAGGGGLVLVLLNIWTHDAKTLFLNIHMDRVFAGYVVNCIALIILAGVLGGIVHEDEIKIPKLIQLGISVPAIAAQLLSGTHATNQNAYYVPIESIVYANEADERPDSKIKDFAKAEEELNSFMSGLTKSPSNSLYLIIHESESKDDVVAFAEQMESDLISKRLLATDDGKPQITVSVYLPFKSLKWSVVLGEKLSHDDAEYLVKKLLTADFKGIRIWDLQCACYEDQKEAK